MVRVRFFKARTEQVGRLRAWMAELAQRHEEVQVMAEVLGDPVPAECLLNITLDSPSQPATGSRRAPE